MTIGEKIAKLRKENNYTQEQLAELLGVSRQSISKYESGIVYPETEKLIRLSELFGCTVDYLLKDYLEQDNGFCDNNVEEEKPKDITFGSIVRKILSFEIKSKTTVWGMPLLHIGINAKGFLAIGLMARGIFTFGLLSIGVLSFGMLSIGLLALGLFSLGVVASGSIAAGALAFGAIAIGIVSFGAVSVGEFAIGALSIGHYFAYGDHAQAMFAFGDSEAVGSVFECINRVTIYDKAKIFSQMYEEIPVVYHWIVDIIRRFM